MGRLMVGVSGVRGTVPVPLANKYGSELSDSFVHGLTGIVTFWAIMTAMMLFADRKRFLGSAPA